MAGHGNALAWVTGAGGLIGSYIVQAASVHAPHWRTWGLTREHLDLTDYAAVRAAWQKESPSLVIHCAAMSKSPACQDDPVLAHKTNVEVTRTLAELACDIPFIFFSTDLVFDGSKGNYSEADRPNPLSVYAETKVVAESIVLKNPKHTVVRTSLNAGKSPTGDRAFTEETRNAWRAGKVLKLFTDEFRSPIPAVATARAIWELALSKQAGIFHLAGSERLSRYEIGQLLARLWPEFNPRFEACSLREYQGAPRPPDTSLNCEKIQELLTFQLPKFSEFVRSEAAELR